MLNRQIYLIGMPGSGKSTIGFRAARDTGIPYLDMDGWIEKRTEMAIPEIFEKYGEEGFRKIETGGLAFLTRFSPGMISLGGGTAMNPVNRKIMRGSGSVILLDRPLEKILEDLRTENRPLLQENPEERLQELYEQRMPVYRRLADVTIRNEVDFQDTVNMLIRVLKDRYHV